MSMPKKYLPLAAVTILGLTSAGTYARDNSQGANCAPQPPAVCYPEAPCPQCPSCLGPENFAGNPPTCPMTCDGDITVTVAAFYWSAHQDGLEYAIENDVSSPPVNFTAANTLELNYLANAEYKTPGSNWDWGFKVGLGYCSPCDGWDVSILGTWFRDKSHNTVDADPTDNRTIVPIWSNFIPSQGGVAFASKAQASWKLNLNLVDLELGRGFWVSRYLSVRPFVGVRYGYLKQHTNIQYNGGAWNANTTAPAQFSYTGDVNLRNNFRGTGLRAGLNSSWNFGCGWSLYGNFALASLYGKFNIAHREKIRLANGSRAPSKIVDAGESFRATRTALDLALGMQWTTMFCSCQYGFTAMLGWEQHMFFNQNQMWKINRGATGPAGLVNNTGTNIYEQRRGSLDTQGVVLSFKLDY